MAVLTSIDSTSMICRCLDPIPPPARPRSLPSISHFLPSSFERRSEQRGGMEGATPLHSLARRACRGRRFGMRAMIRVMPAIV